MKIGTAKYGFTQKKYFKLKDGASSFRILPPLGDLADKGIWSVFYAVHYGYKNSKGKLRVFQSSLVKNGKTKMVEVPDAAAERLDMLKAQYEEAKKTGNKALQEKLGKLVSGQKPMYNLDKNHYLNVIDSQGNIGVLKLRHNAKKVLDQEIKALREKGIDPLSVDNGRFFTFTRSGSGLDTTFAVKVTTREIEVPNVGLVEQAIVHKLDDSIVKRLSDEAAELDKLFKKLTAEEIERIVKASDLLTGNSPAIDEIIDAKSSDGGDGAAGDGDDEPEESGVATSGSSTKSTASSVSAVSSAAQATQETTQETKQEVTQPVQTPVQQQVTQQAVKSEPAKMTTTAETVAEMSDADFLKSLGL